MKKSTQPLIILGAGASHDFVAPTYRDFGGLPLTDDLIRSVDHRISSKYPEVEDIFALFIHAVTHADHKKRKTLEDCLKDLADWDQVCALRFYLSGYFATASTTDLIRNARLNNYKALLNLIRSSAGKSAVIATFNYDTLLEQQFNEERRFFEMPSYIAADQNIKLVKLHGSCDWYYIYRKSVSDPTRGITDGYSFLKKNRNFKPDEIYTGRLLDGNIERDNFYRIPALALPIAENKPFACPPKHIEVLERALETVDRILIIGWKAGDKKLLELMNEKIKRPVETFIVSGSEEGCEEIKTILRNLVPHLKMSGAEVGFGNFLANDALRRTIFGTPA